MSQQKVTLKSAPSLNFWLFGLIALALAIGAISLMFTRMPEMAFRVANPAMQPAAALPARPVDIAGFNGYEFALRYGLQGKAPALAAPATAANTGRMEKFDPATNSILLPGNRVVHPAVVSKTQDLGAGYTLKTGPLGGVIIAPEVVVRTSTQGKRMDIGGGYWLEYSANGEARIVAPQSPAFAKSASDGGKRIDIGGGYWLEYKANGDASIVAPSSPFALKAADAAKVKRVDVGGGYWLETNMTTGETHLTAPQTVVAAAWPKRTYIGAGFWLETDPATGETKIIAP